MNSRTDQIQAMMDEAEAIVAAAPETRESEEAEKHTLLEVWQHLLASIENAAAEKITMQDAARVTGNYPQLKIQDLAAYYQVYYAALTGMRDILQAEIDTDKDCFKRLDDDAEKNRHHYLNLLVSWQRQIREWEDVWECTDDDAHVVMAALADAASFVLGSKGMVAHLESISFQMTPDDVELVRSAVEAE